MKQKSLVIGIGELLWDVLPGQKKIGGAPVNFAYHVSKLGMESMAISAVGKDDLGTELIGFLKHLKINYDVQETDYPTSTVLVHLNGQGVPRYEICEPVAWDFIRMKPEWEDIARNASAVCFGSLAQRGEVSREAIRQFVKMTPGQAYKVFDINLRQHFYSEQLINDSLNLCNVLKINDEELDTVAAMFALSGTQGEICRKLIDAYQLKLLVLTCGTDGSYLYSAGQTSFKETPLVKVADTVGAGDSFTAAIVSGLLNGDAIDEMHETAVKLSAFVCTVHGAMPEYHRKDIEHLC
ncbi:carbohydrate kinase family protein [Gaoshiqia sp. Z1-71]|uniref:carbohydrate kinase family protein n=1 Tax=Gaoshiqia hydrogeniformans TaxID=3290090 RepID=UPI003BF7A3F6